MIVMQIGPLEKRRPLSNAIGHLDPFWSQRCPKKRGGMFASSLVGILDMCIRCECRKKGSFFPVPLFPDLDEKRKHFSRLIKCEKYPRALAN